MQVLPSGRHTNAKALPELNRILSALPTPVRARIFPYLDLLTLPADHCLHEPGEALQYVYFPVDCLLSLLYCLENGTTGEIAQVGNEGVVDSSVSLGTAEATSRIVVQSAGSLYRLPTLVFHNEFARHGELLYCVLQYTQLLISQVAQTALCNRHHSVGQQLCRWLLCATDRTGATELLATEEQIARLLAVRREGITEAANRLQKLGVIDYGRGRITITDRPGLEELACECYGMIRQEMNNLKSTTQT